MEETQKIADPRAIDIKEQERIDHEIKILEADTDIKKQEFDAAVNLGKQGDVEMTEVEVKPSELRAQAVDDPQSVDFIKSEIIDTILTRVFKFVQQTQEMEKQRKTWNLKQSQTKVEKARERRTMWKLTNKNESLRSKLDQIFAQFGDEHSQQAMADEMNQVPIAMAIQQSVIGVIKDQHRLVNKCLLHLMHRSMHLMKHMEYMRMVFFGAQGDFLSAFH